MSLYMTQNGDVLLIHVSPELLFIWYISTEPLLAMSKEHYYYSMYIDTQGWKGLIEKVV